MEVKGITSVNALLMTCLYCITKRFADIVGGRFSFLSSQSLCNLSIKRKLFSYFRFLIFRISVLQKVQQLFLRLYLIHCFCLNYNIQILKKTRAILQKVLLLELWREYQNIFRRRRQHLWTAGLAFNTMYDDDSFLNGMQCLQVLDFICYIYLVEDVSNFW